MHFQLVTSGATFTVFQVEPCERLSDIKSMHPRSGWTKKLCGAALALVVVGRVELGPARGAEPSPAKTGADTIPAKAAPAPVLESPLGSFSEKEYTAAAEALFTRFEQLTGRRLGPGPKGKVGLKIYSDSGPGLATPIPLVKA